MALASVAPHQLAEIVSDYERGKMNGAREMQLRLIPANAAVTTRFGVPGLKAAVDCIGMYGGPVRGPLMDLNESQREEVRNIMELAGILRK
jgi:4-hydroxy-2-oxoglutarate aldolase